MLLSDNHRPPVLEITGLTVHYGDHAALSDVTMTVREGQYLGIIGPNGSGKSTLLKAILGQVTPTRGSVTVFGRPLSEALGQVSYVPQVADLDRSFPMSVREAVLTARISSRIRPFFRYSAEDQVLATELLERVGLANLARNPLTDLSGGEFQKVLIARALARQPRLLLLDEPTANVDTASREHIYQLLGSLHDDITIIMVTHDMLAITSHVDSLACLNRQLVYHGGPQLDQQTVNRLYGCPIDLIAHGIPHRVLPEHKEENEHDSGPV
ncbi:MAG: ABC transporter ATP-binding protein [Eubacteriales bacterium]|nr:ABC transporter ATP-binding protein [Eubacteriales bacterium]MDD4743653.1 ABC transporter ATP-binding protein [Eubacteriales bacterium]